MEANAKGKMVSKGNRAAGIKQSTWFFSPREEKKTRPTPGLFSFGKTHSALSTPSYDGACLARVSVCVRVRGKGRGREGEFVSQSERDVGREKEKKREKKKSGRRVNSATRVCRCFALAPISQASGLLPGNCGHLSSSPSAKTLSSRSSIRNRPACVREAAVIEG